MEYDVIMSGLDIAYEVATINGADHGTIKAFKRAYRALEAGDPKPAILIIGAYKPLKRAA